MKPHAHQLSQHLDDSAEIYSNSKRHRQLLMRYLRDRIWITSSLVSVLTTNILIHVKLFYYPYTLLLVSVASALIYRICCQIRSWPRNQIYRSEPELPGRTSKELVSIVVWTLSALISTTASLFLAYSTFYHASNPFFMVMILSLSLDIGMICSMLRKMVFRSMSKLLIMIVALFFVLRYEYRVSPGRVVLCFGACLTAAFARLSYRNIGKASGSSAYTIHNISFAILAIICIMCWSADKRWYQDMTISSTTLPILACNIIASSIAMHLGGHIFVQLDQPEDMLLTIGGIDSTSFIAPAMVGLFGLLYKITARDFLLPIPQIVAYLVLCACIVSIDRSSRVQEVDSGMRLERVEPRPSSGSSTVIGEDEDSSEEDSEIEVSSQASTEYDESANQNYLGAWLSRTFIAVGMAAWIMLMFQSLKVLPDIGMPTLSARLDTRYSAPRSLDIVVSYFDEPYEELTQTIKYMLPSPSTVKSPLRVMVYNKGDSTKNNEIRELIDATIFEAYGSNETVDVQKQLNVGRESETYLAHIVEHYNDLAEHTIFIQASMHEPQNARKRLQDYFVKETGFLSLSYVDNFCQDCNRCRDQSLWRSIPSDLGWIYNLTNSANNQADSKCQNLVLSYNGQFVVSAARIRGNQLDVYADLRSSLIDPASFQHSPQYLSRIPEGNTDQMEQPYFGFTLERMWGVIMQCSERRIADRCPSLMSGYFGMLGEIEDCQCLDEKIVASS